MLCHAVNEKWENRNNGKNKSAKSEKHQNAYRKGKLQVLMNSINERHKTNRDERRRKKEENRTSEEKERKRSSAFLYTSV